MTSDRCRQRRARPACERPRRRVAIADERGFVGGAEALPFSLIVFVVGILLLANAWAVVDAKMAANTAARETTRVFVESDGDTGPAVAAGRAAFAGMGRDPGRLVGPSIAIDEGAFGRCVRVTVTASYEVPAIRLPLIGGWGRAFDIQSRHSEIVDPFRSGIEGEVQC